jgi:hypothetical protein
MVKFIGKVLGNGEKNLSSGYSNDFKEKVFWIWYESGRIGVGKLLFKLSELGYDDVPIARTLQDWINDGWKDRADELDQQIKDRFSKEVIETKVEMLKRHSSVGRELQEIGLDWLRENRDSLTAAAVTRLIKDGYEIERASVGVPEALTKMLSVSDEELKKQIEAALTGDDLDLLDAD